MPTIDKRKRADAGLEHAAEVNELEAKLFGGSAIEEEEDVAAAGTVEEPAEADTHTVPSVWHDSDDDDIQVDIAASSRLRKLRKSKEDGEISGKEFEKRLREQHEKLNASSSWVRALKKESDKNVEDSLTARVGGLLASAGTGRIPPGQLEITKLADANKAQPCQSTVNSVEFHPGGQLLMTASLDRRVRFFSIDGLKNPHIQSIFLEDMPVHQAQFVHEGSKVFCTGRRNFFYSLDLETSKMEKVSRIFGRHEKSFESFIGSNASDTVAFLGQDGTLPLVSVSSRQLIDTLKMNGTVRSGAFSQNGMYLYTSGGDGVVNIWDMRMRQCLRQFVDEGSLGSTSIAANGNSMIAAGSKSGIVNIYKDVSSTSQTSSMGPELIPPFKSLPHLTTTVDSMCFNSDGQLLAMASRMKRDALRLIHVPTMTAFSNWPTSKSPLHYVHSLAFSPSSGYLAIGNARGRVVMYRLHHFSV
ncbi:hypothetical protein M9434_005219 [Picochlorum sp. BPE23]|nr:hypothetical protein M9434_005219 [Picochlorum sp. BPE23]